VTSEICHSEKFFRGHSVFFQYHPARSTMERCTRYVFRKWISYVNLNVKVHVEVYMDRVSSFPGYTYCFSMARQPLAGQGLLIIKASRSHSVGLLWMSDQLDAETSTWHSTHKRQTSMPLAGFKPTIPASKWLQTHGLDCLATGISWIHLYLLLKLNFNVNPF
jgi:hypothetical protein